MNSLRVPGDVGDGLLEAPGGGLYRCREHRGHRRVDGQGDTAWLEVNAGIPVHGQDQPQVVAHRWSQVEDELADLAGARVARSLAQARRSRSRARCGGKPSSMAWSIMARPRGLHRIVVQLARQPLAFLFLRPDHLVQEAQRCWTMKRPALACAAARALQLLIPRPGSPPASAPAGPRMVSSARSGCRPRRGVVTRRRPGPRPDHRPRSAGRRRDGLAAAPLCGCPARRGP